MRVVCLTNIVSPYRIPFFNHLARAGHIDLEVVYLAHQEKDRQWSNRYDDIEYNFRVLPGVHANCGKVNVHINVGLARFLARYKPHVIVIGTDILGSPSSWVSMVYAKLRGIKLVRWEGQQEYCVSRSRIKHGIYKFYYSFVDGFFAYSVLTRKYLNTLGIPSSKIVVGYNVGDTKLYERHIKKYLASQSYIKERSNFPGVIFLFSGALTERKNVVGFLNAMKCVDNADTGIFILGDGPLRKDIMGIAKEFRYAKVSIEGFKDFKECTKYFGLADIFVLPSLADPASIVLSEALTSGLFVIASRYDGSSHNLIQSGLNGCIVDPLDEKALRAAIKTAYELKKKRRLDKRQIMKSMAKFTVEHYTNRLVHLLNLVLS